MQQIGISPFGMGINAVVLVVVILLFDIPGGILADRWQRKYTLMLGAGFLTAGSLVLGISSDLLFYLVGTVLYGGYIVCSSGTFQAIMYDSLREVGGHKKYVRYQGRAYALFLTGVGISSLAGGYIAEGLGFRWTYCLSVIPALGAIVILSQVAEPHFRKLKHDTKLRQHLAASIGCLRRSGMVFHLGLFLVFAGVLRSSQNEFGGLYFIALGMTAIPMGYANAAKWLSGSLGQLLAERIGPDGGVKAIPLLFLLFSAFTVSHSAWSLVFFYLAVFVHSVLRVQAEAEIQDNIPSDMRATTASMLNFATNVALVPLSLLFGWLAQRYNVFVAYRAVALCGLIYLASWLLFGRISMTRSRHQPNQDARPTT